METVSFTLTGQIAEGELVRWNKKTVIVRLRRAFKEKIIKRHIVKHRVR